MISISIVSFNTVNDLIRCVDSLLSFVKLKRYEILINAFNYSVENKEILRKKYDHVLNISIVFESGIRGYSANHNINLNRAHYDIICILNDDTYIRTDIFSDFYDIMQDPNVGACSPIFLNFDGSIQYLYRKRVTPLFYLFQVLKMNNISSFFDVYENKKKLNELRIFRTKSINYCLGICFCLKRMGLPSGKLNETFFLGPDDLYWSYLIKKNNQMNKILLLPHAEIFHKGHASIQQHFPPSLPAQIKGMIELFEKMEFRYLILFRLALYPLIFFHYLFHEIRFIIWGNNREKWLRNGYLNTLKVFWRHSSTESIFRTFFRDGEKG